MKSKNNFLSLIFVIAMIFALGAAQSSYASGPSLVANNGQPIRWARHEVKGGQLNTNTVDAQGRVIYRVDSGPLGTLSNEEAVKLVDRIFKLYSDIPTSSIEFVNGGSILNPSTRKPIDITTSNVGIVLSKIPTFH